MYNLCQLNSEPFLFRVSSDTVLYILYWTLGNKVRHFVSTLCRNLFVRCINPHWQIPPILKFMSTKKKERWSQLTKRQNWLIREDRDMLLLQLFHYPYCPLSSLLASPVHIEVANKWSIMEALWKGGRCSLPLFALKNPSVFVASNFFYPSLQTRNRCCTCCLCLLFLINAYEGQNPVLHG
jgi:hypothetical protein